MTPLTELENEIVEDCVEARRHYKGTPTPAQWRDWYGQDVTQELKSLVEKGIFVIVGERQDRYGTPATKVTRYRLAERIYAMIAAPIGSEITAGQCTIAERLNKGRRSVEIAMQVLERDGRLVRTGRVGPKGATVYRVAA